METQIITTAKSRTWFSSERCGDANRSEACERGPVFPPTPTDNAGGRASPPQQNAKAATARLVRITRAPGCTWFAPRSIRASNPLLQHRPILFIASHAARRSRTAATDDVMAGAAQGQESECCGPFSERRRTGSPYNPPQVQAQTNNDSCIPEQPAARNPQFSATQG
jgi:hypothetical protein